MDKVGKCFEESFVKDNPHERIVCLCPTLEPLFPLRVLQLAMLTVGHSSKSSCDVPIMLVGDMMDQASPLALQGENNSVNIEQWYFCKRINLKLYSDEANFFSADIVHNIVLFFPTIKRGDIMGGKNHAHTTVRLKPNPCVPLYLHISQVTDLTVTAFPSRHVWYPYHLKKERVNAHVTAKTKLPCFTCTL